MRTKRQAKNLGIVDFESADRFLGNADSKTLCNNTWLVRSGPDAIGVRLHSTNVITYCRDGSMVLRSGGYQTSTTKDRINRFLSPGFQVYQKNFEWYVVTPVSVCEFYSGMILDKDGERINALSAV